MKRYFLLLFCVIILFANSSNAQNIENADIVTVDGKQYVLHTVLQGETLFSLARLYETDQKIIVAENPQLIFGLKQGDVLKIPFTASDVHIIEKKESRQIKTSEFSVDDFIFHVVKQSETVYSISRLYRVSIHSIYQFNPEAEVEILVNEILRIPKTEDEAERSGLMREDELYYYHQVQSKETVYSLAREYEVKVADLFEMNPDVSDHIEIGQIIRIPKSIDVAVEKPVARVLGNFFEHRVESGDTFFSYQRRFDVTREQLTELNPELVDGLQAGQTIKVPVHKVNRVELMPESFDHYYSHVVKGGETLFGISQQYDVDIPSIREFNPDLKTRGLISGETILIPKEQKDMGDTEPASPSFWPRTTEQSDDADWRRPQVINEVTEPEWAKCQSEYEVFTDDTFRISMFLPLYYDMNDSINRNWFTEEQIARMDSLKAFDAQILDKYYEIIPNSWGDPVDTVLVKPYTTKDTRFLYSHTRNFVNFYQGFLLAMDSMQNAGVNVKLNLYDSELSKARVDSLLLTHDFINSNLIVGPVIPEIQQSISEFSNKNRIPLVSPFSNKDTFLARNSYYFQVNPTKEYVIKKTSDFIGDAFFDKNFIVMTLGETEKMKEADLMSLVRDKFFSSGIYRKVDEIRFAKVDFTEGGHM